jgi:hypothetical protein
MCKIADRLRALQIELPAPLQLPPGVVLPFPWVRIVGSRALILRPWTHQRGRHARDAARQGGS